MPRDVSGLRSFVGLNDYEPRDIGGRLPVALVFTQEARAGLSALGWQAVYRILATDDRFAPERVFFDPKKDGVTSPVSEETNRPLSQFAVVAFSLCFEEDYPRVVSMLSDAGIPPFTNQRPDYPIVIGGGPPAFINPAPLAPFFDMFFVGEAEAGLLDVFSRLHTALLSGIGKHDVLTAEKNAPGIYVPGQSTTPVKRVVAAQDSRRLHDPASSVFISNKSEFKDMLLIEINRGCPYACRFCAAGHVYRPPRQANFDDVWAIIERDHPKKVGLVGTALTDWPPLESLLKRLLDEKIKFSLSSVRADGITDSLLTLLRKSGSRTLTLALEGPSHRLRVAAGKNLDEADFLHAVSLAADHGINHLKVYLIAGWPGETSDDYDELAEFLEQIHAAGRIAKSKKKCIAHMTLAVSCLVPKPFTPMQYAPMASQDDLEAVLGRLRDMVKPFRGVRVDLDNPSRARIQGLLARGDASLAEFVELAAKNGGRLKKALADWPGEGHQFLDRERDKDEIFPWDVIDVGVPKALLYAGWQAYKNGQPGTPCPDDGCASCRRCHFDIGSND
ncbi:radical SAM protein [Desulfovibrio inopinatus]|uniref:radical SAM protein n=1 Tax=Desulfovibrio inopinatus TaxID=102109 RepID=UPI0004125B16|nr:radical SAM protein [Desulfovibrio inopinatus]